MAESTLTPDYAAIRRDIGRELFGGNKRDPSNWSANDIQDVDDILRDGYQMFLYPPPLDRSGAYQWRWLSVISDIVVWVTQTGTVSGAPSYSSPNSTITAATGTFYESMLGKSFVFDTSGTGYTIVTYTSSTSIKVAGDASGEASGDSWTITADGVYGLPDEFASIDGKMAYAQSDAIRYELQPRSAMELKSMRDSGVIATGYPQFFAIQPRPFDATRGQRWDVGFYPETDGTYTLSYRGLIQPDAITATLKYVLGGMPYSRAFRCACFAALESQQEGMQGARYAEFMGALQAAVEYDRKASTPESLGRNLIRGSAGASNRHGFDALTKYNGQTWGT